MKNSSHNDSFAGSDVIAAATARVAELNESFYPATNTAEAVITRVNGEVERVALASPFNMRTNAGATFWYGQLSGTPASASMKYLALSANSLTLALTDTTLSGEITTNGCARALATVGSYTGPTSTTGTGQNFSYTLTYTWTCSGSSQTVQSAGALTAASGGTLCLEANFSSSISLNNGDSLALTWTISS